MLNAVNTIILSFEILSLYIIYIMSELNIGPPGTSGTPGNDDQTENSGDLEKTLRTLTKYIRDLQNVEQGMYSVLRNSPNISDGEKEQAVSKINELSSRRESLNEQIQSLGEKAKQDLQVDFQTFQQQMRIVEAAERQLNESKIKLKLLNDEKLNKLRLVQINTYYEKRYDALGYMMKYIVIFLLVAVAVGVGMQKGFIPSSIGSIILAIYFGIGIVFFYLYYTDIRNRSNRNFDEYDWKFDRNMSTEEVDEYNAAEGDEYTGDGDDDENAECKGEECCSDGMTYDEVEKRCMTEEGMSNALTQNIFSSTSEMIQVNDSGPVEAFSDNYENFASF